MITIVLPAYNEADALPPLLEELRASLEEAGAEYRVIVVDDGSADDTAARVREHAEGGRVSLVQHEVNKGLAEAIRTGLLAALQDAQSRDIIITMDSDNTHAPGLIQRMVRLVREGCDVVIASRYQPGARVLGVPARRQLMSWGASVLFRLFFPIRGVKDYTCGYRAYRASCLQAAFQQYGEAFISATGFACMVDILLRLRAMDLVMAEVPMILRYDRKPGASKMNVGQTVRNTLALMWERKWGRESRPAGAADQKEEP
jgi:dolichol-phosphate mannosyltransferase